MAKLPKDNMNIIESKWSGTYQTLAIDQSIQEVLEMISPSCWITKYVSTTVLYKGYLTQKYFRKGIQPTTVY